MSLKATKAKPTIATVAMALADTEYSYQIPAGTRSFEIKLRDPGYPLYLAIVTGFTTTYVNIPQGHIHKEEDAKAGATTLYFKTTANNQTAEILSIK